MSLAVRTKVPVLYILPVYSRNHDQKILEVNLTLLAQWIVKQLPEEKSWNLYPLPQTSNTRALTYTPVQRIIEQFSRKVSFFFRSFSLLLIAS
jgi:hypothetical protein